MGSPYTEKEIAIFHGLIRLIKSGANPYLIKVQDMADAANIGKGTVYDYFKSKEEAISKAILYSIRMEIETAMQRVKSKNSFRDKLDELLEIVVECLHNNLSTFNLLLSFGGAKKFCEFLRDDEYNLAELAEYSGLVIADVLQKGYEENIICIREDAFYQRMAIHSCISGFAHFSAHRDGFPAKSVEDAKDVAYRQLIKMLN